MLFGGPNRVEIDYGQTPGSASFDRVTEQRWGLVPDVVASGAGGRLTYTYTGNVTSVNDRNGNDTNYTFTTKGSGASATRLATRVEVFTNRDVRGSGVDPVSYVTTCSYNADERICSRTAPLGDRVSLLYDELNPDRYAQGNLVELRRSPNSREDGSVARAGIRDLVNSITYEPVYQRVRTLTSPRGNDPIFVPPSPAGSVLSVDFDLDGTDNNEPGTTIRKRRYTTLCTYDYQEADAATIEALFVQEDVLLADPPKAARALALNTDLNGDGLSGDGSLGSPAQLVGRKIEQRTPNVLRPVQVGG
ncbi:MAG: hypothetical protein IH965_14760, partial [Gemmatimonadetes bacterium]|nr:hypothetical protein [Gemmatimonadota bacterium]